MPSSQKDLRSQCPVGFEAVNLDDSNKCPALEDVLSDHDHSSLWLMRVPYDFNLESLTGQTVILNGSQALSPDITQGREKRYEMHSRAGSTAELSSFTVLLPSSKQKSFCSAGTFSGQMSVIQSVVVPLSTNQEVVGSPKKSSPKKTKRTSSNAADDVVSSSSAKKKTNRERNEITEEIVLESPKHIKDKREAVKAETLHEDSDKNKKYDSPSKKKNKDGHKVVLTQFRFEPKAEKIANGEQYSVQSPRKRKTEVLEEQGKSEDSLLRSNKKKRKHKSSDSGSPGSAVLEETLPRSMSHQDSSIEVKNVGSNTHIKDKSGHESEPEKSRKKKKKNLKMKTL